MTTRTPTEQWKITTLCGCAASSQGRIDYCPTHAQAPAMLAYLRETTRFLASAGAPNGVLAKFAEKARAILRAVEG